MDEEQTDTGTLETWTVEEVAAALEKGEIALIDVRTVPEYMLERIPGALLVPMNELDPARLPSGEGKPLVFHCGSGKRSETVAKKLLGAGHDTVRHMGGGFGAWKTAGRAHIATDMASGAPVKKDG